MQDSFARARTRPRPSARDDRVSCIQYKYMHKKSVELRLKG